MKLDKTTVTEMRPIEVERYILELSQDELAALRAILDVVSIGSDNIYINLANDICTQANFVSIGSLETTRKHCANNRTSFQRNDIPF